MEQTLYLNFRHYGYEVAGDGLKVIQTGNVSEISIDVMCSCLPYDFQKVLQSDPAAYVDIVLGGEIDGALSRVQYNPFWSRPSFERNLSQIPDGVQNILLKIAGRFLTVLPVSPDDIYSYISPSDERNTLRIKLTRYYEGADNLKGVFAVICEGKDPYQTIQCAYEYAVKKGYIKTPLRKDKKLPDMYKGLGWCTWNAFYHDVTEQGIIDKLEELKEKKVPLKWLVIDDGWSQISEDNDFKITSFYEDRIKFPHGLKGCIERIKRDYGIEKVGVWHSFTGYWYGIEKDSELYRTEQDLLLKTHTGYYIPNGERAYDFFWKWYQYLKEQGVDFVKMDTQGNGLEFLKGMPECVNTVAIMQREADRAVHDCFGENVINCMGMHSINAHNRPYSVLSRNSDDFYPDKPESFKEHIEQNVYNAVFHGNLFYCDFDMWWTNHDTAKQSSILRMISGGPVYISDRVGETNPEIIDAITDQNGTVIMCDDVPLPTEDCLFGHSGIIKVFNRCGNKKVTAVFNMTNEPLQYSDSKIQIDANDAKIIWEVREV